MDSLSTETCSSILPNNNLVKLTKMRCPIELHEDNFLIFFCVDPCCLYQTKLGCIDCLYDFHEQHKTVKLKNIEIKINEHLSNERDSEDILFENRIKSIEESILIDVEHLRTDILEILNIKTSKFIKDVKTRLIKGDSGNFDIKTMISNEVRDLTTEELSALTNHIKDNYIKESSKSISRAKVFDDVTKFENSFKMNFVNTSKQIKEYLNSKLFSLNSMFNEGSPFDWSDKTYANYGFLYSLSNNNHTATKSFSDGTITMLRSVQSIEDNKVYTLEATVNIRKGGDFDFGIGNDSVGSNCWIRALGGYGFSNVGIYSNGRMIDSNKRLLDDDTIVLEVDMKEKFLRIKRNGVHLQEMRLEIKPPIYYFCAVRKIGNSVTVKNFIVNE